jgi:hypothetical protein
MSAAAVFAAATHADEIPPQTCTGMNCLAGQTKPADVCKGVDCNPPTPKEAEQCSGLDCQPIPDQIVPMPEDKNVASPPEDDRPSATEDKKAAPEPQ